jgi:Raf kinase inhibitor-like YbhB/YbcL family protein
MGTRESNNGAGTSIRAFAMLVIAFACGRDAPSAGENTATTSAPATVDTLKGINSMALKVTSSAFSHGGAIPSRYTCEGDDVSPPLSWSGVPAGAKSIAIIVDDPDAPDPAKPQRVYVHWVVYDIPAGEGSLSENASKRGMPKGAVQGKNDWGKPEYGGPCPPIGRHRYFFKLYALDTGLTGLTSPTKADLERAMKGHVVDSGELMGTYQKAKK